MRSRLVLAAGLALTLVVGAAATTRAARPSDPDLAAAARAVEVARIRAHFDSVLVELAARDLARLTSEQRGRRLAALATLRAYRDRGVFPRNHDFPGQAVPYFVDRETGTLCAVAHLLAAGGRRDIVDRVARTDNNVWVASLAGDTAFTAWLDANGLTLVEAARIQVPYVDDGVEAATQSITRSPVSLGATVAGTASLATALWNATGNAQGASRVGNVLGFTSGMAAMGLGAAGLADDRVSPALAAANVAAGMVSVWLSSRSFGRHAHHQRVAAEQRAKSSEREAPRASVAPLLPVSGESGAGVAVTVRF